MRIDNGVVTMSIGAAHFKIAPYPILVTRVFSSNHQVNMFEIYTDFKQLDDGFEVNKESFYHFTVNGVQINDPMQKLLDAMGLTMPEHRRETSTEIVRRSSEDNMKSECPSFEKHWDAEVKECKDCAEHFSEEYTACKSACEAKQTPPSAPAPAPDPAKDTTVSKPAEAPKSKGDFKGFRKGSRADVLIKHLASVGKITYEKAAEFISKECEVEHAKALENVKGYVWEWKKGVWAGTERDFEFVITVEGDEIIYKTKE